MMPQPSQVWLVVEPLDLRAGTDNRHYVSKTPWAAHHATALPTPFVTDGRTG